MDADTTLHIEGDPSVATYRHQLLEKEEGGFLTAQACAFAAFEYDRLCLVRQSLLRFGHRVDLPQ